jgi:hypothetical protein
LDGGFVGLDYFFGRKGHRGHNGFKSILLTLTGLVASRQDAKEWAKSHPFSGFIIAPYARRRSESFGNQAVTDHRHRQKPAFGRTDRSDRPATMPAIGGGVTPSRPSSNPKGIPTQSPRLPPRGYLGSSSVNQPKPQRGCGQLVAAPSVRAMSAATPLALFSFRRVYPR